MKKNSGSQKRNRISTRKLRLESLENRELLTATPWDSGAADIEVAAAATVPAMRLSDLRIDLRRPPAR